MKRYGCDACGSGLAIPALGDPDGGIAPGTAFEDIAHRLVCPQCEVQAKTIFLNSVATGHGSMIHDQLSHGTKPPIIPNHLIYNQDAIFGIDGQEFSASQDLPRSVIKNHAYHHACPLIFMPIDVSCRHAMVTFIPDPFALLLFLWISN